MAKNSIWQDLDLQIETSIEEARRAISGSVKYAGAKLEWSREAMLREMDVPIEDILSSDYYLGCFKIWPTVRAEIEQIWHYRCDFDVTLIKDTENGPVSLKSDRIYALSFEHAERRAREKWPVQTKEATRIDVRRDKNIHTVVLECPKGTGKNFEASLILWILTREFLIQDREEFFRPYELDLGTTISINLMNRSGDQARRVTFKEVLPKLATPFFRDYFPPQVSLDDTEDKRVYPRELRFPRNVVIFPGTGSAATGLGYCIGSGVMDEANFMQRTEGSKDSITGIDSADAADDTYGDLFVRHQSRFGAIRNGRMTWAGLIVCLSSTRTSRDFTQRMRAKSEQDPGIMWISQYYWERKPLKLSGKTFTFDLSTMRIDNLEEKEKELSLLGALPSGLVAE